MALDPRIALGVQPLQVQSPMQGAQQALTLRELMAGAAAREAQRDHYRMAQAQLAQQQQAQQAFQMGLQQSGGEMTPQLASLGIAAGMSPTDLQSFAGMSNWGKPKVASWQEVAGEGGPRKVGFDAYGNPVGEGFSAPVKLSAQNLGNEVGFFNEYTGQEGAPRVAKSPEQTEVERLMLARGIKPGSPEWNSTISGVLMKKSTHAPAANTTVYTGTMVPVEGPDGKPAYAMPAKDGTYTIAPGVRPPGAAAAQEKAIADAASARDYINLIDMALEHPGRETATGRSGVLNPSNYIPGTDARDFMAIHRQLEGKAFLDAFNSLKGGGPITDIEGKKATEASVRLDTAQSDEAYEAALKEARSLLDERYERVTGQKIPQRQKPDASGGGQQSFADMPDPAQYQGRVIRDSSTGVRYRSNGRSWVRSE